MVRVKQNEACPEYYFREGCYISEWWNTPEDPACSIARVRLPKGQTTLPHTLRGTVERYVLLAGQGVFISENQKYPVRAGDVVYIPGGTVQSIENPGSGDLIFLAICTPRFKENAYEEGK